MACRLIFAIVVLSFWAILPVQLNAEDSITIGAIASLSGPAAEQGKNWLEGATLASEELRRNGVALVLAVEDDGTNPVQAAAAFKRLRMHANLIGVVGGTWDFLAAPLYSLARESKVPFLTPTNPPEIVDTAAKGNEWVFANGLSLAATEKIIRSFLSTHNPSSCAILVPAVPFGILHAVIVERLCKDTNANVISNDQFEYGGYLESIRTWTNRVTPRRPDLVFMLSDYTGLDLFARELERLKVTPVVITTQHLDEAAKLSGNSTRYQRVYGVYPQPPSIDFVTRFTERFTHAPKVYAAEGYDAVKFLYALRQGGTNPPLPGFEYKGVTGNHKVNAGTSELRNTPAVMMQVNESLALQVVFPLASTPPVL